MTNGIGAKRKKAIKRAAPEKRVAKTKKVYRDSGTGKFTQKVNIKRNPDGTETQTVKVGRPKPGSKKK